MVKQYSVPKTWKRHVPWKLHGVFHVESHGIFTFLPRWNYNKKVFHENFMEYFMWNPMKSP